MKWFLVLDKTCKCWLRPQVILWDLQSDWLKTSHHRYLHSLNHLASYLRFRRNPRYLVRRVLKSMWNISQYQSLARMQMKYSKRSTKRLKKRQKKIRSDSMKCYPNKRSWKKKRSMKMSWHWMLLNNRLSKMYLKWPQRSLLTYHHSSNWFSNLRKVSARKTKQISNLQ